MLIEEELTGTPELAGKVRRISADISHDEQTGATFYTIRFSIAAVELARVGANRVAVGMQAEVFVRTEDRTPARIHRQLPQGSDRKGLPGTARALEAWARGQRRLPE